jgi:1-deoxy-D-xylulose-5-phosphate synthase
MADMLKFLEELRSPAELKRLSIPQLEDLAAVIRRRLVEILSLTGGHLAPNLGVVELTLALFARLDLPEDDLVWDVSHQTYVQKMLTGRYHQMDTLRQFQGLSGFAKRSESPYDKFGAGHANTAVSGALGMAQARDVLGLQQKVVAIAGDGALTGGLCQEGLLNAGHMKTQFLMILNDNQMSISPNVGALSQYLDRIRSEAFYRSTKEYARKVLQGIPRIGKILYNAIDDAKDSLKYLMVPGVIFEELGFTYLGPVDGHDFEQLLEGLDMALGITDSPVVLHVRTTKGKGYAPAEGNVPTHHGLGKFDRATGKPIKKAGPPSWPKCFAEQMIRRAIEDDRVVAITPAMAQGSGLVEFQKKFPERFFDVGIAEQHAVCVAAGMATRGLKPVVAIYSSFLQRAYDQVIHDVCLQKLPVVFSIDRSGVVGDDGPTHHGVFDLAFLRIVPHLVVAAPRDGNMLQHMLRTGLEHDGPFAFRYPRGQIPDVALDPQPELLEIGKAEALKEGDQVLIAAVGTTVYPALEAANLLEERMELRVGVLDLRFIKPLDVEAIAERLGPDTLLVTAEEGCLQGGVGSGVLEGLLEHGYRLPPLLRLGIPDEFVPAGSQQHFMNEFGLTGVSMAERILDKMEALGLLSSLSPSELLSLRDGSPR